MNKSLDFFPERRAQSVLWDLAFGVFIFMLLFAFLYAKWQESVSNTFSELEFEDLDSRAVNAVDFLVSSKGSPTNWHLMPQTSINSLGLVKKKRVVDSAKLSRFLNLDYNFARDKLALSYFDFQFRLYNSQGASFSYGISPDSNFAVISLRRIVDYNGVESVVEFTVFKS